MPINPAPSGNTATKLQAIPGSGGLPLIGNSLQWLKDPRAYMRSRYEIYGEVSWSNAFGIRLVSMLGPDAAQFVLMNRDNVFSNEHGWTYFIGPFFHRGVMLLDFDEHRHHRRIMQTAFTTPALRGYLDTMNPAIEQGIAQWQQGEGFEVFSALKQLTLDIATKVFMGYQLGPEASKLNVAFIDTVRAGTGLIRKGVPFTRWHKGIVGRRVLEDFFRSQLKEKRNSDGSDMFAQLCRATTEEGDRFADDDIVNHMIFLMMAAHDTTTITLTSIFYQLAKNPQWQERLREESFALGKPHLEHDDLDRMNGMTLVIKEALRLLPLLRQRVCGFHAFHAAILESAREIRPATLFPGATRRQGASLCMDAVRWRRPQMHRAAFCRHAGQGHFAPGAAPVSLAGRR